MHRDPFATFYQCRFYQPTLETSRKRYVRRFGLSVYINSYNTSKG